MLHPNKNLKISNDKRAVGTVVGTVFFLAILLFFLSQVILWSHQVNTVAEEAITERMNTPIKLEITGAGGDEKYTVDFTLVYGWVISGTHNDTHSKDNTLHDIKERKSGAPPSPLLDVRYTFVTGITQTEFRLIKTLTIHIYATYEDEQYEHCSVLLQTVDGGWVDTWGDVMQGWAWLNMTIENPEVYIHNDGTVVLKFDSDNDGHHVLADNSTGILKIDYMDIRVEPIAVKVTALGGTDTHLIRLWIIEENRNNHLYADLDDLSNSWISAGGVKYLTLSGETRTNPDGSILAEALNTNTIKIWYNPPSGETVYFRVLTERGNMASCSYTFP